MFDWMFDAFFFWVVLPIAALEAIRVTRTQRERERRTMSAAALYGGLEFLVLGVCASTGSPLVFLLAVVARLAIVRMREGGWWTRGPLKAVLMAIALVLLMVGGQVVSFADLGTAGLQDPWRFLILTLLCASCVISIVPMRVADERKETLAAPPALILFVRVGLPLVAQDPRFSVAVPIIAAVLSLVCALWLFSAGKRANNFEPSMLVSELLVCERGVILSFVWMGLVVGEHLAGIGALLEWWSGTLALLALEASLRRRPLPKPMAFFALAMAANLPGTIGFVAEDLLAHGLIAILPWLAATFVCVVAINATALYLALANVIVDLRGRTPQPGPDPRPSFMMLTAAGLALLIGLVPQPFVATATNAHVVIAHPNGATHHPNAEHYGTSEHH